ncbi:type I polyketide synthase [Nocardia sp. CNY236]|uniref:type I polyketide synthase n=1 Tax=Nocardia sp. CNY236 TaxID=1169152 RepID=UPI000417253B|nr:type I polyketide synthase [Nocardia sp. CNY236]
MNRIAIVGMGCVYPDATDPRQLWENSVSGRRAFRSIPDVRTSLADYYSADPATPDTFYADNAAVLTDYTFDRTAFKIAGSTYHSTDLTHWLALDVASRALADAGFENGEGLPRERTGVVVGNTLTGEFSRANLLRLRWPYVRRVVATQLRRIGWDDDAVADFVDEMEDPYKAPFPHVDEDTLAGALANTIAGRICNYFDLQGGGYTVDGACSSSLLSVTTAARSLIDGELDVAVAGGVDLSIDPFEIVGFAKTGALARTEMKLYDKGSNGFWPGEGCGMVVLMREEDALAAGRKPLAHIAGWGVSSDGAGAMTRPDPMGYQLALRRAYERAGFGIETVPYFEGHGTGTPVGDDLELSAISSARRAAGATDRAAIGSVKAQIGHTKAAAGVAGLIKAVQAVRHGVVPPTIGCRRPHLRFTDHDSAVRPVMLAEPWPDAAPLRAGVSSMGFGGINTHIVVEGDPGSAELVDWDRRPDVRALAASRHDAELLLLAARTPARLAARLREAAAALRTCSYSELTDYAMSWAREAAGTYRAATVVTAPKEAVRRLVLLAERLEEDGPLAGDPLSPAVIEVPGGGYLGRAPDGESVQIGLLFPGQGTGSHLRGGVLARHLPDVTRYRQHADAALFTDVVATQNAQPLTVIGSLYGLAALRELGISASSAAGHSLGELCALAWAGAIDSDSLVELARMRGTIMAENGLPGTMASLDAPQDVVRALLPPTHDVTIAALNSPRHTVVSGTGEAVAKLLTEAESAGIAGRRLPVSHAFHSPLALPAAEALAGCLDRIPLSALPLAGEHTVVSTVTGAVLAADREMPVAELSDLLCRQIVEPVRFAEAVAEVAARSDLLIEVGPGHSMARLAVANAVTVPVVGLDSDDPDLTSYLAVAAATWVGGALPDPTAVNGERFHRDPPHGEQTFLSNPAESVAADGLRRRSGGSVATGKDAVVLAGDDVDVLDLLIRMTAERAELPLEAVGTESRMLDDLHLSSITVGQVVARVASAVGVHDFGSLNLATSTIGELAAGLESLRGNTGTSRDSDPLGAVNAFVGTWIEEFSPMPLRTSAPAPVAEPAAWIVHAEGWTPTAEAAWLSALAGDTDGGVLLGLPADADRANLRRAFSAVRAATTLGAGRRLVVLGGHDTTTALAKTLFLEHSELRVTVVDGDGSVQPEQLAAEVAATDGFVHVRYLDGIRYVPHLVPYVLDEAPAPDLGSGVVADDRPVLLATGGGKGITAECALEWARHLGARVAIVGRSIATTEEVSQTLRRFEDADLEVHYVQADFADSVAIRHAVEQIAARFGAVTHVLHGAGRNDPAILEGLTWTDVENTFAPKVDALSTLLSTLAEVDDEALRHVVTFSSVIGRSGMWGEAHYAMANAELARVTRSHGVHNPQCRTTCLEWSVWSGIGMGVKMGAVESLAAAGISAISPADGTELFIRTVTRDTPPTLVVCGRTDSVPTLHTRPVELPLSRFVDRVRRHHPGFELVADAVLSVSSDPYLLDHEIDGDHVLPAVIGLEAMAQFASAITGVVGPVRFTDVRLDRPIIVPAGDDYTIRLSAVRRVDGAVDVVLLGEESDYAIAHFAATAETGARIDPGSGHVSVSPASEPVALDPDVELYGRLLFQRGRFQRVRGYDTLSSTQVRCRVSSAEVDWFSSALPADLLLGDPGVRDALMHGNQVSVPDATLLPQRIDLLEVLDPTPAGDRVFLARETRHDGTLHVYDIDVFDERGVLVERWRGLHLRAVRQQVPDLWSPALLGPHFERVLADAGVLGSVQVTGSPEGTLMMSATLEGASCAVRCAADTIDDLTDAAFGEILGRSIESGEIEVRNLGGTRGLHRMAAGPAQALVADVETTWQQRVRLTVAWLSVVSEHEDKVVA